jgi:YfiH family protein
MECASAGGYEKTPRHFAKRMKHDWITPDWPAPANVRAFVTTRNGGVSIAPRDSLNLGYKAGDDPQAVTQNRARVSALMPQSPKWLAQVHGTRVVDADAVTDTPAADASVASNPGTVCAIMIADCLPILFADREGNHVAAAHAGWRGLSGGVIANTVAALRARGADPEKMLAYIGPGIGPTAFEVGTDVLEAFAANDPNAANCFRPHLPGKWLADLFALARRALAREGVCDIHGGGLCTYRDPQRFFSYRRDKETGRMAAFIWRE